MASDKNVERSNWRDGRLDLRLKGEFPLCAALESKLDPQRFFRANRQQIINLECIRSVDLGVGGRPHVQLNDGRKVEFSRRQTRQFRERTTV
jgi:DNA-binding LytR/AlgR family response regulator